MPVRNPRHPSRLLEPLESRFLLAANIIYVDAHVADHSASAVRNGASWASAYDDLQAALASAAATPGQDDIWIAQGTYKPTEIYAPGGATGGLSALAVDNLKTFNLPDGVTLYGGFAYGQKSLSQRDPVLRPTILDGDLAGDDVNAGNPGFGSANKADNAWHVVTLGDDLTQTGVTATLDGLTIINGFATGPNVGGTLSPFVQGHSNGGGVFAAFGSNLTIRNSLFQYNFAAGDGGGVFSDGSDLLVTGSRFLNNSAIVRGGALETLHDFEVGSHTATILGSHFESNTSAVFGGAIVGEGAFQGPGSTLTIRGSSFVRNEAPEGGAIVIDTLPVLVDQCTFTENVAYVTGGALATTNVVATLVGAPSDYETTITRSTFTDNLCWGDQVIHDTFFPFPGINFARGGGALTAYMAGYLNVDRCLFVGNQTLDSDGGAILNGFASANLGPLSTFDVQTKVTNSVFLDNSAVNGAGGAIASETDGLSASSTVFSTRLIVESSSFVGNSALRGGGAIFLDGSSASITRNAFSQNTAPIGSSIYGGASMINGFASGTTEAMTSLMRNGFGSDQDPVLVA